MALEEIEEKHVGVAVVEEEEMEDQTMIDLTIMMTTVIHILLD